MQKRAQVNLGHAAQTGKTLAPARQVTEPLLFFRRPAGIFESGMAFTPSFRRTGAQRFGESTIK
jgi:hypothetical protein